MRTMANTTTIDITKYTNSFLTECSKKLKIEKEDFIDFKATFFHYLFSLEKDTPCAQSEITVVLKKSVLTYNTDFFHKQIVYQEIEEILLKSFRQHGIKEDVIFLFCNLTVELKGKSKTLLVKKYACFFPEIKKEIVNSAIHLLIDFSKHSDKKNISWELFSLTLFDTHKYYIVNKNLVDMGTTAFRHYAIKSLITLKYEQFHRKATGRTLVSPPDKNDIFMKLCEINLSTDHSLPLLCHYFGHDAWYSLFSPIFAHDKFIASKLYRFTYNLED